MNRTMTIAGVVIACAAGAAWAQTPLPLTNPSFEVQNLFSSSQPEGWHNLSNPQEARYLKSGTPTPRTGTRSVFLTAPARTAAGQFRGWTTDTVNDTLPTFPFYDPVYDYNAGDIVVTGYYLVPASSPITEIGENIGIKLNVKLGNQDYATQDMGVNVGGPDINIARLLNANGGPGHTNGQWVAYTVTWPKSDIDSQFAQYSGVYYNLPPYPDHCKITIGRFIDFPNIPTTITKSGTIYWDDIGYAQTGSTTGCPADYNGDTFLNLDDLGDFITDFYTLPAIPGGAQVNAPTYSDANVGFGTACPNAADAPAPYAVNAYRQNGYRVGYSSDGSNACPLDPSQPFPNLDNLNDYITFYYSSFGTEACS